MKQQIRHGVFETNSSSTHSIQLVNKDEASSIAYKTMIENLKDTMGYNYETCDVNGDNTLLLHGFEESSSDENHFVSHEINTPINKIQYMFSILYMYLTDSYEYIEVDLSEDDKKRYRPIDQYCSIFNGYIWKGKKYIKNEAFNNSTASLEQYKEYIWFRDLVLKYLQSEAYKSKYNVFEITHLEVADNIYTVSTYSEEKDSLHFESDIFKTKENFTKFFNEIMDENKTILIMDVPYYPYSKPQMFKN